MVISFFLRELHFAEMGAAQNAKTVSVLFWALGLGGGTVYSAKVMKEVKGFLPAGLDPENREGLEPGSGDLGIWGCGDLGIWATLEPTWLIVLFREGNNP